MLTLCVSEMEVKSTPKYCRILLMQTMNSKPSLNSKTSTHQNGWLLQRVWVSASKNFSFTIAICILKVIVLYSLRGSLTTVSWMRLPNLLSLRVWALSDSRVPLSLLVTTTSFRLWSKMRKQLWEEWTYRSLKDFVKPIQRPWSHCPISIEWILIYCSSLTHCFIITDWNAGHKKLRMLLWASLIFLRCCNEFIPCRLHELVKFAVPGRCAGFKPLYNHGRNLSFYDHEFDST